MLHGPFIRDLDAERRIQAFQDEPTPEHLRDPRLEPYCDRRGEHLTKLALLHSIARSQDLGLKVQDVESALTMLTAMEAEIQKALAWASGNPLRHLQNAMLAHCGRMKKEQGRNVSEAELRRLVSTDMHPADFLPALGGLIREERLVRGADGLYSVGND